jgi:hypothetical protein
MHDFAISISLVCAKETHNGSLFLKQNPRLHEDSHYIHILCTNSIKLTHPYQYLHVRWDEKTIIITFYLNYPCWLTINPFIYRKSNKQMSELVRIIQSHPRRALIIGASIGVSVITIQYLWRYFFASTSGRLSRLRNESLKLSERCKIGFSFKWKK